MIQIESRHELAFPREAVWPILSKTDWLNRALRIPPVAYEVQPRPEGGSWVTARAKILGREMRWRELPFEWLEPEYYHVRRIFETGPFTEGIMGMTLEELPGNRTRVLVSTRLTPR